MNNNLDLEQKKEKAIIVAIHIKKEKKEKSLISLRELEFLAATADLKIVKEFVVSRDYIDSKFVIGTGKAEEILEYASSNNIQLIIFDEQLTPVQERNLRKFFNFKVLDRVELILDIFAKNARTHEARIQIELAQLKYLLPRLTRMWEHLSRQIGGVGVRGPGETQIEIDRRRIREKIHVLNNKLEGVRKNRRVQRKNREKNKEKRFALVGYTNAGKTSLLNLLTEADALVKNMLFCTLDPLSRKFKLNDGRVVLLTDTVGFITKLPHFMVESFKATLDEVFEADCLIHVIDGSDPDLLIKIDAVNSVLFDELKLVDKWVINIINKSDLISDSRRVLIEEKVVNPVFISVKTGDGIDELEYKMIDFLEKGAIKYYYYFPMNELKNSSPLYTKASIFNEEYKDDGLYIEALVPIELQGLLKKFEVR